MSREREELFDMARSIIDGELGILVNGYDIDNTADALSYAILAAGWVKPEYEWATQYTLEPQPIRAISEESAREMAAMAEGVQLLKRPAAGEWTAVNHEPS